MTQPTDRETALIMFRSTLALHGTPSPEAARIAIMFAARMAAEAGMLVGEYRRLTTDEYELARGENKAADLALRNTIDETLVKQDQEREEGEKP